MAEWSRERQDALRETLWTKVKLCGCGSGTTFDLLLLLLERGADHDKRGSYYDPAEDASKRWVEFGAHVLDSMDLTSHGTGIGGAWLTDTGRLVLEFLREFGTDDSAWPEWASADIDP